MLKSNKRVVFSKDGQKEFIEKILTRISLSEASKICHLSERTIRDWRRERFLMDLYALQALCRHTKISFPKDIELRDFYWYALKGARVGGLATYRKYGKIGKNPEYRKKKWREWWEREGQYQKVWRRISAPKLIKKPRYSKDLAEFVGIVLGDGGISKYQLTITLHMIDDKEYGEFVVDLIKRLFAVPVSIYSDSKNSVNYYVVSRIELIRFCLERLGLKQGNKIKQQVNIPNWIKQNKQYSIACVRGLVDTDGSVFTHKYKVSGKEYKYKKLAFTSASKPLLYSVYNILKDLNLNVRIARGKDVRIDSVENMKRYFKLIGSHNPKHLKRYRK